MPSSKMTTHTFNNQETELLQIIQMHTRCSEKSAIELLTDIKYLVDGKTESMKFRTNTGVRNTDKMVSTPNPNRKRGFF